MNLKAQKLVSAKPLTAVEKLQAEWKAQHLGPHALRIEITTMEQLYRAQLLRDQEFRNLLLDEEDEVEAKDCPSNNSAFGMAALDMESLRTALDSSVELYRCHSRALDELFNTGWNCWY